MSQLRALARNRPTWPAVALDSEEFPSFDSSLIASFSFDCDCFVMLATIASEIVESDSFDKDPPNDLFQHHYVGF